LRNAHSGGASPGRRFLGGSSDPVNPCSYALREAAPPVCYGVAIASASTTRTPTRISSASSWSSIHNGVHLAKSQAIQDLNVSVITAVKMEKARSRHHHELMRSRSGAPAVERSVEGRKPSPGRLSPSRPLPPGEVLQAASPVVVAAAMRFCWATKAFASAVSNMAWVSTSSSSTGVKDSSVYS
jgi:hypothetical protein